MYSIYRLGSLVMIFLHNLEGIFYIHTFHIAMSENKCYEVVMGRCITLYDPA